MRTDNSCWEETEKTRRGDQREKINNKEEDRVREQNIHKCLCI